ncbi:MAG: polyphosphate kinase 1 [Methylotenera sp.]|uniref:polyphosphate kinase 1 n=1 Tax=Methylotenera sp. TaxID=2051956 RepID=UPI0027211E5A|nr:polyphosphate kinase 1 [Methylotenera sp.]MDO9205961.1 polyphosphate kinase 1 [Methylotenera sp.]MDO9394368.1 polyphosphate kinase 1 [Methylotenera sp.]MDP1522257.1 polyphosphate kinase 1 [Methylotenera sp.]MDP2231175.1 polyphosphate kinase 1 [Methylotenera sp.]MDP3140504.1 polyphosphate kinase 1 [Methylotenera sp.]
MRLTYPPLKLLNRDISILAFNQRVLSLAQNPDYPLLERLRFVCIVSSNLDEFFEVRAAPHVDAMRDEQQQSEINVHSYQAISDVAHALVNKQYQIFNTELMPALANHGVHLVSHGDRTAEQRRWVAKYFESEVRPLLVPVALDPSHPFPLVANKALNFIVLLGGNDAFGRSNNIAIVKVPRVLPRLIKLPKNLSDKQQKFVSLSSVIRAHLSSLFTGREVINFSQFRVTRHSDLAVDEEDVKNLRTALRKGLVQRNFGDAVRLEVSHGCDEKLAKFLLQQFDLPEQSLYRVNGLVNLARLMQLADLAEGNDLKFKPFEPKISQQLVPNQSFFTQLKQQDILIHQPYESFESVIDFLREAVYDPDVLSIQQTIYRTGSDPRMLKLLQEAVRRGKEVMAVVELKARFDEEANINWAEDLESVGAQVVYGIVGLKTHAKMLLVMRREGSQLKHYGHVSTGNYNPRTARLYTDVSMLTSDIQITRDMEYLFRHIASQVKLPRMQKLLVAPFNLHRQMLAKIRSAELAAKAGKTATIILKMNALTDEALVVALVKAGRAGVEVDLILRGACILPVDAPGLDGRIRVRSIIGRLLEHSRIFYFKIDQVENMWLSSADWMNRNMMRRVEIAWPITDEKNRARILQECCQMSLDDNQDAWLLNQEGTYTLGAPKLTQSKAKAVAQEQTLSAQQLLLQKYAN